MAKKQTCMTTLMRPPFRLGERQIRRPPQRTVDFARCIVVEFRSEVDPKLRSGRRVSSIGTSLLGRRDQEHQRGEEGVLMTSDEIGF